MPCAAEIGLSIIVLLLDDMRHDQLPYLPLTTARLAEHAVTYDQAYVTIPMCCPERASFLAGGFLPQFTGVLTNAAPRGGATAFDDSDTLAVRLQSDGYATMLVGKYLNEYSVLSPYIPPGWSYFASQDGQPYAEFEMAVGASGPDAGEQGSVVTVSEYVTGWQANETIAFFAAHPDEPVFTFVPLRAPHDPHTPAPQDVGSQSGFRYRGGAFNEADVSDKPAWIQALPLISDDDITILDRTNQERLETLASVDRAVVHIVDALERSGRAENTVLVLTSDNGQQWGEHRLVDKGVPYQESVHVPLILWNPAFEGKRLDTLVAANLDVAATITDLAGLSPRGDGRSLRDSACSGSDGGREWIPLQGWPYDMPVWAGAVTTQWKYVEWGTGERELYDLISDPTEATNTIDQHSDVAAGFATQVELSRGLAVTTEALPNGQVGTPLVTALSAWGGVGVAKWKRFNGEIPGGLSLAETGELSGVPTAAGTFQFTVMASDEGVSPYDGSAQRDIRQFTMEIAPATALDHGETGCSCDGQGATALGALGVWVSRRQRPAREALGGGRLAGRCNRTFERRKRVSGAPKKA